MKRIRCPKCDEPIMLDDSQYEAGRTLVFECKSCHKQFRIRVGVATKSEVAVSEQEKVVGTLVVIENAFHLKQEIPLRLGDNVVGRRVQGTKANTAITTVDPSVDTTHCVVTARHDAKTSRIIFEVRDAGSNTGTFVNTTLLSPQARLQITDGTVITIGATTMILRCADSDEAT